MTASPGQPPAGWYPDPAGGGGERFWDGEAWSQATRDGASPAQRPPFGTPAQAPTEQRDPLPHQQQPWVGVGVQPHLIPAQGHRALAGFWIRVVGYIVDAILMSLLAWVFIGSQQAKVQDDTLLYIARVAEMLADPTVDPPALPTGLIRDMAVMAGVTILLWAVYRTVTVATLHGTLGQKACGLRVAMKGDESLAPVGWKAAAIRGIAGGVLYEFFGFLAQISVLFTNRKQTLPDMISRTVVVNTRKVV
ncbi:RDD family protein [uncultured Tessaracoccus sp.]|uniref:RDD family protein n=1 Tax=uncultured Tessaracoccus sp. TaxID=905023 RepID=UPI0025F4DEB9|nr:RDD family protein [uncultured Tessaracoccus sp.]